MRILAALHGHLGVLAVAALIHPTIVLWRGLPISRGGRWAIVLSSLVTTLAFSVGTGIYEAYRAQIKRSLFLDHRPIGVLFETKEHLAFAVVCLALGGLGCALLAPRSDAGLRRLASRLYLAAAVLGLVVASIGTIVTSVRGF